MQKIKLWSFTCLLALFLVACDQTTATPPPATPEVEAAAVVAEGHLVPNEDVYLTFAIRGKVAEVLVQKGEVVAAGQVLARLDDSEIAQANVAAAELDLAAAQLEQLNAQQTLDTLTRTVALTHAQAWVKYLEAQTARATAERAWEALDLDTLETDLETAEATVQDREAELEDAQEEFDKYADLDEDNAIRQTAEDALETAQESYNEAQRQWEVLNQRRDTLQAALDASRATEAEAKHTFETTAPDAISDALLLAQTRLATAQAHLEAAEAQLAAAQKSLANYELKAPFAGTVTDLNITAGEAVGTERWVVQLADFSAWYVETSDLTELEVVKVAEGQVVQLVPDALDLTLEGTVESIALASHTQSGDVLYTVKILVPQVDPRLRWGMTVEATFEPETP